MKYVLWALLFAGLCILSTTIGAADLSLGDTAGVSIFFISRLPRLIAILMTGMSIAVAGLIMQQLSQNKFAAPSTSGTIESASLGILVALLFFGAEGGAARIVIAFLFALLGLFIYTRMLAQVVYKDTMFIPLLGIMFGRVIAAVTTFIAYKYDLVQSLSAWMYGDFSAILVGRYELLYLGEAFSTSLGLNYAQVRMIGLLLVALLTSTVVLTVGEIPFIGLIVPNLVTLARGDNVQKNLPYTAFFGGLFVLAADILGRVIIYPFEISVSLVIGVLGGAMFLYFLLRRKFYA